MSLLFRNRRRLAPTASNPIRVLFLLDHLRENGGLRVVHELALRLQVGSTRASMFVLQGQSVGPVLTPSAEIPVVYSVRRRLAFRWAVPLGLWRLLWESRHHDVLVSGSEIGFGVLLGGLVSRLVRKPLVILVQSPLDDAIAKWVPRRLQGLTRWVDARAAGAVCVSAGLVKAVVDNGLPRERVYVIPVGLDANRILARALEPSNVEVPAGAYILAVGRLDGQKGFDVLIRAHSIVLERGLPHTLLILGEGDDRADLEKLADQLQVRDSLVLAGFVENPHPALANADAFVLSSRREGMGGLVLLEALAHSTPIIATDCLSGPRELLDDGRLGQLIPVDDVEALADAIQRHLKDPAELRARAAGGPERLHEFEPDNAARAFTDAIAAIVTGG